MRGISNEVKTGVMVVMCLFGLLILVLKVGNFTSYKRYNEIRVLFDAVEGIEQNAPVRLRGVDVGEVKKIDIVYSDTTSVELTLKLESRAKVRADSRIRIVTLGLMGEKYVDISGGTSKSQFLENGATVKGESPYDISELVKKSDRIADNLDSILVDLRTLTRNINDKLIYEKQGLDKMYNNIQDITENFRELSEDIKDNPWKLLWKEGVKPRPKK